MTRVTHELRGSLRLKIMAGLPVIDYVSQIHALVQQTVIDVAPAEVKVMYADPERRRYLGAASLSVRLGNKGVPVYNVNNGEIIGCGGSRLQIQLQDDPQRLPEGSVYRVVLEKLQASGLVNKYFEQDALRDSVNDRLRANLAAAKTFKQLYAILEPELHHFIPKDEAAAQLPACVAPVVDDLRKLGATLPATPKAAG